MQVKFNIIIYKNNEIMVYITKVITKFPLLWQNIKKVVNLSKNK